MTGRGGWPGRNRPQQALQLTVAPERKVLKHELDFTHSQIRLYGHHSRPLDIGEKVGGWFLDAIWTLETDFDPSGTSK